MGILPWSFGFVLIMTVLSWAMFGRLSEETLVTRSLLSVLHNQAAAITDTVSARSVEVYNNECRSRGIKYTEEEREDDDEEPAAGQRLRSRRSKHRLTSKLHIRSLFSNEDAAQKPTQEYIFRNLLKTLYGSVPLCSPKGDNDPYVQQIFDEARAKVIELGPKLPMVRAQHLANIELSGPNKTFNQFALFLMLRGGKGEVFAGAPCVVHPLLSYVNMSHRETCVNVYLAPAPLLKALFDDDDVVDQICQCRKEIYKKASQEQSTAIDPPSEEKGKDAVDALSNEFKARFESYIPSGVDPQFVEFRVSRTRPKDFPEAYEGEWKSAR